MLNSKWFLEQTTEEEGSFHALKEIIYTGSSKYQKIDIIRIGSFGKCLVLDGKIQSTEKDEFIYHEALVHPALILHNSPKRILIAGGGDGATAREVLKHPSITEVFIVDIDKEVVMASKQFLPELHCGSFEDNKVKVIFDDARRFIENERNFDVIIIDLPEPTEGGPALLLYTKEFYENVFRCLNDDGIFVTQSASASVNNLKVFSAIVNTIKMVFPVVSPYTVNIPSFYSIWGFTIGSKIYNPKDLTVGFIDEKISKLKGELKFYDGQTHLGLFNIPKHIRLSIEREGLIISDSSPISFY